VKGPRDRLGEMCDTADLRRPRTTSISHVLLWHALTCDYRCAQDVYHFVDDGTIYQDLIVGGDQNMRLDERYVQVGMEINT
jgi:hypothetical protein